MCFTLASEPQNVELENILSHKHWYLAWRISEGKLKFVLKDPVNTDGARIVGARPQTPYFLVGPLQQQIHEVHSWACFIGKETEAQRY